MVSNPCVSDVAVRRATVCMDTVLEVQLHGANTVLLNAAIDRSFALANRLCRQFSRFDERGEVGQLNASCSPFVASPRLARLLKMAIGINSASLNAFSIVSDSNQPDARAIEISGRTIRRRDFRSRIDLGAIAKGFIIDEMVALLRRSGARDGLVNAGGDLRAFGERTWPVMVRHPEIPDVSIGAVGLQDSALCVSAHTFRPGHIIDPRRGRVARGRTVAAAVMAETATLADAWATALFVEGRKGLGRWFSGDRMAGCVIERRGRIGWSAWKSKSFRFLNDPDASARPRPR